MERCDPYISNSFRDQWVLISDKSRSVSESLLNPRQEAAQRLKSESYERQQSAASTWSNPSIASSAQHPQLASSRPQMTLQLAANLQPQQQQQPRLPPEQSHYSNAAALLASHALPLETRPRSSSGPITSPTYSLNVASPFQASSFQPALYASQQQAGVRCVI